MEFPTFLHGIPEVVPSLSPACDENPSTGEAEAAPPPAIIGRDQRKEDFAKVPDLTWDFNQIWYLFFKSLLEGFLGSKQASEARNKEDIGIEDNDISKPLNALWLCGNQQKAYRREIDDDRCDREDVFLLFHGWGDLG
ncbi:MAG: hypothetical protein LBV12_06540 [Puniceicoccales bacterium]|nr:hypothetical protein [Puniceicoccales bacterium]